MTEAWQSLFPILGGGTVFDMTHNEDGLWLLTEAGIFHQNDDGLETGPQWQAYHQPQPLPHLTCIAGAGRSLLAGNSLGQMAFINRDIFQAGQEPQWYQGRVPQTQAPITCLALSPTFMKDGVALAGTAGDGMLRTKDGGKSWFLVNAGLQDFDVLALAVAPTWERREICFAATAEGFYRSPNGGRAWKLCQTGLEGVVVLSLAISPNFAQDKTVYAGTEEHGLYRSTDTGRTWQAWQPGLKLNENVESVNALWLHPNFVDEPLCVAALGSGRVFCSVDGGQNWQHTFTSEMPIFSLCYVADTLYAGINEQGLLTSQDAGSTWQTLPKLEQNFVAQGFSSLAQAPSGTVYAHGLSTGLWASADQGQTWQAMPPLPDEMPLLKLFVDNDFNKNSAETPLFAGSPQGLYRSTDGGQTWQTSQFGITPAAMAFSTAFTNDGPTWLSTEQGHLLISMDKGLSWQQGQPPLAPQPIVQIEMTNLGLMAVTYNIQRQQLNLHQSPDRGATWQQIRPPASTYRPDATLIGPENKEEALYVALGRQCWCYPPKEWAEVLALETPIIKFLRLPNQAGFAALSTEQVLLSAEGQTWSEAKELVGRAILDVIIYDEGLLALEAGGRLWRRG